MVYRGTIRNGVVVLDDGPKLMEGQRVLVDVELDNPSADPPTPDMAELLKIAGKLESGRRDGSVNHDHYIYGTPQVENPE